MPDNDEGAAAGLAAAAATGLAFWLIGRAIKVGKTNLWDATISWFKEAAEWVQENLGDPAIAEALREDLGLKPGESIPANEQNKFGQFKEELDPDKVSFDETVAEIVDVVTAFIELGEALKADNVSGFDIAWLIGSLASQDSVRLRFPAIYALAKLTLFVSDDPESMAELDPALLVTLLRGDPLPPGSAEALLQRLSAGSAALVTILEAFLDSAVGPGLLDAYYGWDPAPGSDTPQADFVSTRALTLLMGAPGGEIGQAGLTLLGVPPEHGGPGLFMAVSGALKIDTTVDRTTYKFIVGATDAFDVAILPGPGGKYRLEAGGSPQGLLGLDVIRSGGSVPALRIGDENETRLEISKLGFGVQLAPDRAGFRFLMQDAALIVNLGKEPFLKQLENGEIKIGFDLGFTADTSGFRFDGGSRLRVTIPIGKSVLGVFTAHYVELALGPSPTDRQLALEISGAFKLTLGPFRASVDRMGFLFDMAFREGSLGFMDLALGFKPPNGIGLLLDAGIVKGGGYLFIDQQRGEYAGALELKIGPIGVKAIALLSTKMPDGSEGWSLLLMIYGQFPPIQLSWGFVLTGIGGMIGLQHSTSLDGLQASVASGVLDDILFPEDPVGDAPRIINRLRVVFPPTRYALIIGPFLELGWGTPPLVIVRLGIIIQLDNVLGGDRPVSFGNIVLLGQVRLALPAATAKKELTVLRILVDFLGFFDFDNMRLGFMARMRDSRLMNTLELHGMLVVAASFRDKPTFIFAAGGFHPKFQDKPSWMPAPIDRLGVSVPFSAALKIDVDAYFAITPATVQAGLKISLLFKAGPIEASGWLGFDAILYLEPDPHFLVLIEAGVKVKFKSFTLCGVTLKMELTGPGLWRAVGDAVFEILFWEETIHFDESWGESVPTPPVETAVGQQLQQALSSADAWSAQLPQGGESLVTLGPVAGAVGPLAHPLGRLVGTQKIVPFGLEIQRFGASKVKGARRFDVESVEIGGTAATPMLTHEYFARAQFLDLSEDQKLSGPSFERFPSGVQVGSEGFVAPGDLAADIVYETKYLDTTGFGRLILADVITRSPIFEMVAAQARGGAAGQSALRQKDMLRPAAARPVTPDEPRVAVVVGDKLESGAVSLSGFAATTLSLAQQVATSIEAAQVVEAFELV